MGSRSRERDIIVGKLRALGNPKAVEGMARFGIRPVTEVLAVPVPTLRRMARKIGKDHELALELWSSSVHEARVLASLIDDPALVSEEQMEDWALTFDSWDVCDSCCSNLFDRTPFAYAKVFAWSGRDGEYVKRAGYVLMAVLAVHDKEAGDGKLRAFLPAIARGSVDDRNFVRKAVNWALRQIGKRNQALNRSAIATAERIAELDSPSARWVASDAVRELRSEKVQARLRR